MSQTPKRALSGILSYSEELGLDLKRSHHRFKWFLASVFFAKRISADIAKRTYREFEKEGLTTPDAILQAGWDKLVRVLDAGGYVRYDFSTASTLLELMAQLKELGGLERIHENAEGSKDLEKRLMELKGVGPTAVNIFLREIRGIWQKARPRPSKLALAVAEKIGLKEVEDHESSLVRVAIEYCKRRKCGACQLSAWCRERKSQP